MLILMIFTIHTNININIIYIYLTKKIGESSISVLHTSDRFDGPRGWHHTSWCEHERSLRAQKSRGSSRRPARHLNTSRKKGKTMLLPNICRWSSAPRFPCLTANPSYPIPAWGKKMWPKATHKRAENISTLPANPSYPILSFATDIDSDKTSAFDISIASLLPNTFLRRERRNNKYPHCWCF
jgi:hypothetical protein